MNIPGASEPGASEPVPRGLPGAGGLRLNSLATADDLMALQNSANAKNDARLKDASWKRLTVRGALRDARDALYGLASDLYGNSYGNSPDSWRSLRDLFRDNRLRGVGVIMVVVAFVWLLVDAMLD